MGIACSDDSKKILENNLNNDNIIHKNIDNKNIRTSYGDLDNNVSNEFNVNDDKTIRNAQASNRNNINININNCYKSINSNNDDIQREEHIKGHADSLSRSAMNKINMQMDSICKIEKSESTGTGFLCSIPYPDKLHPLPVLITCYHIIGIEEIQNNKEIILKFNNETKIIKFDKPRKIYTSDLNHYDCTIIELKEGEFKVDDLLEIDDNIFKVENLNKEYKNKTIYIIHYPKGKDIQNSVDVIKSIDYSNSRLEHFASTKDGSSGAPIFILENFKIIGIHLGKYRKNNWNI